MKYYLAVLLSLLLSSNAIQAQVDLSYYLPDTVKYDPSIPTPSSIIGHEVGEWHVTHDRLVYYMRALADASDRIQIQQTGVTYEGRPQLLLTITHPDNLSNIEEIRNNHKNLTNPEVSTSLDTKEMPAVIWMGYSVHGNEPSGSNASMLMAYHLAAAQGDDIEEKLKNVVILMDPSFNPDGLNRFATWVNMHKSEHLVTDPNDREFNEVWPGGRTNHYWFDLNRDWLPAQLTESKNRLKQFHSWKPNIMTDHHEMGTNSTFFFQPGIPSRTHPITPEKNQNLTAEIGEYHAKFLDAAGSLYFTKESYDDFYYGKGSTFPDVQGAIGILFEQASSRGHAQESVNGILKFPFTIKNQFITSLSTLQAGYEMRENLLNYQRGFYIEAKRSARESETQAYVVSDQDASKLFEFSQILTRHEIDVYRLNQSVKGFQPDNSIIVPVQQYQSKLIQAIFERRTSFTDSLFYDVSAWTFPLAFNLQYESLNSKNYTNSLLGDKLTAESKPKAEIIGKESNYAYLLEWEDYFAPKALNKLLNAGLRIKVATEEFTGPNKHLFKRGTILIPVRQQNKDAEELYKLVKSSIENTGVTIHSLNTGNTKGVNLGSRTFEPIEKPTVAMLVGSGISSYDAGEIWHLMDQRFQMAVTKLDINSLNRVDLNSYNTLIIPNVWSQSALKPFKNKLNAWVNEGGNLITFENASKWLADSKLTEVQFKVDSTKNPGFKMYSDNRNERGAQAIGGAIFEADLDLSHPLAFGYSSNKIPIFKGNSLFMKTSDNAYANPVRYTSTPLMSGYISSENVAELKESAVVSVDAVGRGRIISFTENTNFRAFWYGTNKLFMNAIFFGPIISRSTAN